MLQLVSNVTIQSFTAFCIEWGSDKEEIKYIESFLTLSLFPFIMCQLCMLYACC